MGPGGPGEPEELIDSPNGWFPARMVDFSRRRAWQKSLAENSGGIFPVVCRRNLGSGQSPWALPRPTM